MHPDAAPRIDELRDQLLVLAREFNHVLTQERGRRQDVEHAFRELQDSYMQMVRTLAFVVEAKDTYTRNHLDRTYQYAFALARRVAPELAEDASLGYGFLLHDIGKVGIPESVLLKPGPLTEEEWSIMRTHPLIGVQVVSPIKFLGDAVHIIRSHHERWDGRGYPEGLRGDEIHLAARIFSVADTFDAMTTDRPYRTALPVADAMEEIVRCSGTQFDPDIAPEFVRMCEELQLHDQSADDLTLVR